MTDDQIKRLQRYVAVITSQRNAALDRVAILEVEIELLRTQPEDTKPRPRRSSKK